MLGQNQSSQSGAGSVPSYLKVSGQICGQQQFSGWLDNIYYIVVPPKRCSHITIGVGLE